MEEMKNIFKDIFYTNDDGDYIPLFKENSQELIIKLYKDIYETNEPKLILNVINFMYEIMKKCVDIAIILESSLSIKIENKISFIELLSEIYVKFPNEVDLKNKIIEIIQFLIENISINPNNYFYIFRNIVNKEKNPSFETFNNYIDILKILYPKKEQSVKKEKYFFFYNALESGIQIDKKIVIPTGFAFKFWFYIEKYHKNSNANLIKIKIGDNIYKLNLNGNEINIFINDKIQEGLNYETWNNIVFGITKTFSRNSILFSYKLEEDITQTKIKATPIIIQNISLDLIIFFENFIGRVSSIILYNDNKNGIIDYFEDNIFKLLKKRIVMKNLIIKIFNFSTLTFDLERMEIEELINHFRAFFIKKIIFI